MFQNFQSLFLVAFITLMIAGGVWLYVRPELPSRFLTTVPSSPSMVATSTPPFSADPLRTVTGTTTVLFVGDIMPSRFVAARMEKHGYDYPFRDIAPLLQSADITFGNLEAPILHGRKIAPHEMVFRGDPEFISELQKAGFDIVTLANNHTPNFGEEGLRSTFRLLAASGIRYVGAGTTTAAYSPVVIEANDINVAFVAGNDTDVIVPSYCADDTRIGTACFSLEKIRASIIDARKIADVVVFTMHAGDEYHREPNARQQLFAHTAIDAGADIVIGHHPHVIQTKETYKGKPIYYSLGNFIFDQDLSPEVKRGLVVIAAIDRATRTITAIEEIEVTIEDYARPVVSRQEDSVLNH